MTIRPTLVAFVIALVPALAASAQNAPAGNAHPESSIMSADEASFQEPFGPIVFEQAAQSIEQSRQRIADKVAFARAVDLEPLRGLAVFNAGRVKIIDTLARETVTQITGRRSYIDYIHHEAPGEKPDVESYKYDPLFTLFDLIIDPGYYIDKPLIHVNYLPLRRAFIETAFPDDAEQQQRWMKLTRLSQVMVFAPYQQLSAQYGMQPGYADAFRKLERALLLWEQSGANMVLVAPPDTMQKWSHISMLDAQTPVRVAASRFGAAWRAKDAPGATAAAADLANALRQINQDIYPTSRANLELTYNKANAFEWGLWAYCFSLVTLLLAFGTGRKWLIASGVALLVLGFALHGFGFGLRCIIAERYAIQNQFESITGVSLFAVIVAGAIMLVRKQWLYGAAAAAAGFIALVTATQTGVPGKEIGHEAAILNTSVLLKYHVTTVLVSYGLITLGFIVSLFYLAAHYLSPADATAQAAKQSDSLGIAQVALGDNTTGGRQRTLRDLDTAQMTILQLAFWTLAVGLMLGAWWADHSWGRWWAFDPKETWALLTWIVYLAVIHLRFAVTGPKRALVTAWMSVFGFIVMLWTYFGVNLLLPGLHAYA